jgi:hypothetical protein
MKHIMNSYVFSIGELQMREMLRPRDNMPLDIIIQTSRLSAARSFKELQFYGGVHVILKIFMRVKCTRRGGGARLSVSKLTARDLIARTNYFIHFNEVKRKQTYVRDW